MNYFGLVPVLVKAIEWFIANEPALESDAVGILSKAKDILTKMHNLRTDVATDDQNG